MVLSHALARRSILVGIFRFDSYTLGGVNDFNGRFAEALWLRCPLYGIDFHLVLVPHTDVNIAVYVCDTHEARRGQRVTLVKLFR